MKKIRSKSGMTLIEIVAGAMIFTIVALMVSVVVTTSLRMYGKSNELAESGMISDSIANTIIADIGQATEPLRYGGGELIVTVRGQGMVRYEESDGALRRDGIEVLPTMISKSKMVNFAITDPNSPDGLLTDESYEYILTVRIIDKNGTELLEREYGAAPVALYKWD